VNHPQEYNFSNPGCCIASDKYIDEFMETLDYDLPKNSGPAAFIAESIQGVGGTVQYPKVLKYE